MFSAPMRAKSQVVAIQPGLHGLARQLRREGLEHAEHAGDGNQLGMKFLAEHARADFAPRAGHRAAAQRAVDVHAAVGHHFGAGADGVR